MAAFFRLESFCDECDASSCTAGDGITPGGACVGWEPDLVLRALDLDHLVHDILQKRNERRDELDEDLTQRGLI